MLLNVCEGSKAQRSIGDELPHDWPWSMGIFLCRTISIQLQLADE